MLPTLKPPTEWLEHHTLHTLQKRIFSISELPGIYSYLACAIQFLGPENIFQATDWNIIISFIPGP